MNPNKRTYTKCEICGDYFEEELLIIGAHGEDCCSEWCADKTTENS